MCYKLLSSRQHKLDKSTAFGHLSKGLQLQPAFKVKGLGDTCPYRGKCWDCNMCLVRTGHNNGDRAEAARIARTELLASNPTAFKAKLVADIEAARAEAARAELRLTMRLNTLSDLDWPAIAPEIFTRFIDVQFIDYTKRPLRPVPPNYYLTYSWNERSSVQTARDYLAAGYGVAVIFRKVKPAHFTLKDPSGDRITLPVFDGDTNDLRHLDPKGHIIGLKLKTSFNPLIKDQDLRGIVH